MAVEASPNLSLLGSTEGCVARGLVFGGRFGGRRGDRRRCRPVNRGVARYDDGVDGLDRRFGGIGGGLSRGFEHGGIESIRDGRCAVSAATRVSTGQLPMPSPVSQSSAAMISPGLPTASKVRIWMEVVSSVSA